LSLVEGALELVTLFDAYYADNRRRNHRMAIIAVLRTAPDWV